MKSRLNLNNPLWRAPERRVILDKAVQESAAELESEIKQRVLKSAPRGRVYRKGSIKGGRGSRIHRASAKGQPFASDTGATLNATRARKTGDMKATVVNSKAHSKILDDPQKLDRQFFESTARTFKPKFKANILEAIKENS